MFDKNYILAPKVVTARFEIAPAFNALESIRELTETQRLSGLSEWVTQTAAALPEAQLELNRAIFGAFQPMFFDETLSVTAYDDFPSYVDAFAALDPFAARDAMLKEVIASPKKHPEHFDGAFTNLTPEQFLGDVDVFRRYMGVVCKATQLPDTFVARAFELYNDPPQMMAVIVEHLRWVWDEYLAPEWVRILPMLQELVAAFETMELGGMSLDELVRTVTTRDLSAMIDTYRHVDNVVFVPSAHIGPYVLLVDVEKTLYALFGARLPRSVPNPASALNRAELLTRLNALADDTRLRILELLTTHEELCAQDIIERLGMSQSSASRHLSQLSANGFIVERRREVAKCYSLNTDRVVDTLRSLTNFLARQ